MARYPIRPPFSRLVVDSRGDDFSDYPAGLAIFVRDEYAGRLNLPNVNSAKEVARALCYNSDYAQGAPSGWPLWDDELLSTIKRK